MPVVQEALKCDECQKPCMPVNVHYAPKSSEWYCPRCHRSYPMHVDDAGTLNEMEAQHRAQAQARTRKT